MINRIFIQTYSSIQLWLHHTSHRCLFKVLLICQTQMDMPKCKLICLSVTLCRWSTTNNNSNTNNFIIRLDILKREIKKWVILMVVWLLMERVIFMRLIRLEVKCNKIHLCQIVYPTIGIHEWTAVAISWLAALERIIPYDNSKNY